MPSNLLVILSDEHSSKVLGCYGNPVVKTPHLNALAARGTRFAHAYTNSPVCVPARASMATGKYVNQVGFWDNADPYDGSITSWHHRAREAGHRATAIGKLHFRSHEDDNGFSEEMLTMHVVEGKGDLMGLVRDELPERGNAAKMANLAGPGESSYTRYDRQITARACAWLEARGRERALGTTDKPWVLKVSLVAPHFPLTAPEKHYWGYFNNPALPMPKLYRADERPSHPYLREYAASFSYDKHFADETAVRRAIAGYYGLCSFLDDNIGQLLAVLEAEGLSGTTQVIYVSDHGDNLGARGLWGKSTMYEESVAVPLIVAGPGVPMGRTCRTPASLVDMFPTVLDTLGIPHAAEDDLMPGRSLDAVVTEPDDPERLVFSEYHGMGSTAAAYMVRKGRYKYVHYIRHPAQLFDLAADPEEFCDLASDLAHAPVRAKLECELRLICDPEKADRRAKTRQQHLLELTGGRQAVLGRGDLGYSPPPGIEAEFQ
jgi:choline-sulfatase